MSEQRHDKVRLKVRALAIIFVSLTALTLNVRLHDNFGIGVSVLCVVIWTLILIGDFRE